MHQRVVIVRLGASGDGSHAPGLPLAMINPGVIEASEECKDFDGCPNFPCLYGETARLHHLRVIGLDEYGKPFDQIYEDLD
jgi:peptide deformylase